MDSDGFSIRCPHCFEWAEWPIHPEALVVSPGREIQEIVEGLTNQPDTFSHPKMLECKSSVMRCTAPFQAFVVKDQQTAHKLVESLPSWAIRRAFRPYRQDHYRRWDDYSAVLICTRHVVRQKHIELEHILDRELLSRASVGVAVELKSPVTVYAATVFETAGTVHECWVPVEAYSTDLKYVPPRYNLFCEICRQSVIDEVVREFDAHRSPADCPLELGRNGTCAGRAPACMERDWSHCPAFLKRRYERKLCYWCDCELISRLEEDWRERRLEPLGCVTHKCWAGFTEIAVPVEVHEHLIAVMMTGQYLLENDTLVTMAELFKRLPFMEARKEEIVRARDLLLGHCDARTEQERYTQEFRIDGERFKAVIKLAQDNRDRLARVAFTRYRQYRARSETEFKNELMGNLDTLGASPNTEMNLLNKVLGRMREFWAFKGVYFLTWQRSNQKLSVRAFGSSREDEPHLERPRTIGMIDVDFCQAHPLTWLYNRDENHITSPNAWAKRFQRLFSAIMHDDELHVPLGPYYFMVAVPFGDNVHTFVFAVRDEESVSPLRPLQKGGISEICQEAILDTCISVIRKLGEFWYQQERGKEIRFNAWKDFSSSMAHEISNEVLIMRALQRRFKSGREDAEDISDMKKCIDNISGICTDLLHFSIEKSPQLNDFDLGELITDAARQFEKAFEDVVITSNIEPRELICCWDRGQIYYVLAELLQNATHHTPPGGLIHVSAERFVSDESAFVRMEVFNTGKGIPEEDKRRIFTPFYSTRIGGTGVGLSTVADIVSKHGGRTYENGQAGENANFVVEIPQRPQ